eukprot:scaffold212448_cov31-Tisochrysis_lutea.AAC.3
MRAPREGREQPAAAFQSARAQGHPLRRGPRARIRGRAGKPRTHGALRRHGASHGGHIRYVRVLVNRDTAKKPLAPDATSPLRQLYQESAWTSPAHLNWNGRLGTVPRVRANAPVATASKLGAAGFAVDPSKEFVPREWKVCASSVDSPTPRSKRHPRSSPSKWSSATSPLLGAGCVWTELVPEECKDATSEEAVPSTNASDARRRSGSRRVFAANASHSSKAATAIDIERAAAGDLLTVGAPSALTFVLHASVENPGTSSHL